MKRVAVLGLAVLGFGLAGTVSAQIASGEITYEQASILAGSCFACHSPEGVAPGPIPSIAGMPAETMIALMDAFRQDLVPGATMMGRLALGYTDAEIAAIARYFSGEWGPQ